MATFYRCDICKKELDHNSQLNNIITTRKINSKDMTQVSFKDFKYELCIDCFDNIERKIKHLITMGG